MSSYVNGVEGSGWDIGIQWGIDSESQVLGFIAMPMSHKALNILSLGGDPFFGMKFDGTRYDCGDKIGFLEANIAFALDRDDMKGDLSGIVKKIANKL